MAKQVVAQVKIQIPGGQATPAPPVGTALGPQGINIGQFVMQFNEKTKDMKGTIIPVVVTIYSDGGKKSFDFITKSPPAAVLLKQAAQVAKGAANPKLDKVGKVTRAQVLDIAKVKFNDMNSSSLEQAALVICGTARSMGIEVVD